MFSNLQKAIAALTADYPPEAYPTLQRQYSEWQRQKPLAGLKVLDATPVFRNTLLKYRNLLAAGAELTVGVGKLSPCDPAIVKQLQKWQIPVVYEPPSETFDMILDCSGCFMDTPSRYGYVELTRSGIHAYTPLAETQAVFAADSGRIKAIETCLGTGESFLRAYNTLSDVTPVKGTHFVLFGYGKVGRGIVFYLRQAGAQVTVVDLPEVLSRIPAEIPTVSALDRNSVEAVLSQAYAMIAVTGVRGALSRTLDLDKLAASPLKIFAMGPEDEFGPGLPAERVEYGKKPLNFILDEPTKLEYIETTMALHSAGATELLQINRRPGMHIPRRELEDQLLADACTGCAGSEIKALLEELEDAL